MSTELCTNRKTSRGTTFINLYQLIALNLNTHWLLNNSESFIYLTWFILSVNLVQGLGKIVVSLTI